MLGEPLTETAHSLWPHSTGTTCMSYPTVVRSVEPIELPPTERLWQRSEEGSRCQSVCPTVCVHVCVCTCVCVCVCVCAVASVVSTSAWPRGWQPAILLCPWDSPGNNTRGGCSVSFCLLHWQAGSLHLCPTNLPESFSLESILAEQCEHCQEGSWVRMSGQRQPGN